MVEWARHLGLLIVLILIVAMAPVARGTEATTNPATQAAATQAAATQPAEGHKLKVGVLVSYFTATGPSRINRPYGYEHAAIADALRDPAIQLFPLIERDSETDEELAKVIAEKFPQSDNQAFFADDIESLKSLDAIVMSRAPNLNAQVIDGVTQAVQSGVGLLVVGPVGVNDPGYTEPLANLLGMTEDAGYAFCSQPQDVELVAADDPLIKGLGDAAAWAAQPNGVMGTLKEGAKPLIKLSSNDALLPRNHPNTDFCLLYMTTVGKGPVIVCNWSGVMPEPAKNAAEPGFYVRCVLRLKQ